MKRVLVTGAQGFVGRWLVHALDRSGLAAEVLGLGRSAADRRSFTHHLTWQGRVIRAPLPAELLAAAHTPYRYRQLDICDLGALADVLDEFRPHWVLHMASGLRDDAPGHLCRTNVEGTTVLTQALVEAPQRPESVVYGSSGSVYGVPRRLPLTEDVATDPCTMYGLTKLAAEQTSALLAREHGLPVVWARLFNLVGPGQDERHVCGRFAASLAALRDAEAPRRLAVGPLATTRDFIDVRDAAHALLVLARSGCPGQAYNIASGDEVSIREVLDHLLQVSGLAGAMAIETAPPSASDVDRHVADVGRLRDLGFAPRIALRQSLRDLLAYYTDCVAPRAAAARAAGSQHTLQPELP